MMYYGNGMNGWGMLLMVANSLLFWALVVACIVVVVRYTGRDVHRSGPVTHGPAPQRILAERFARGDIDEDDYTRRLQVLDTTTPAHAAGE